MVTDKLLEQFLNRFKLNDSNTQNPFQSIQPATPIGKQPVGSLGTESYSGYPQEEYLHTLRGRQRAKIYDQMRRSDPQIFMCISAVKNPIMSANWEVEAFDDTPESQADKELIEHILFKGMDKSFNQFLQEALTMVEFGHSVFEVIHNVGKDSKIGSYNGIQSISYRSQKTIERWNLVPQTGQLLSITQYAYGDLGKMVDVPAEFLIVYSLQKEGANFEGISLIRQCYGPWFRKNNYLKLNAIGIEKFAVPTPLVEVPEGKHVGPEYDHMITALESYLQHQNNYLTYPAGWKVGLNSNVYDPAKVEQSIDSEDRRMTKSFLANFLELGMQGTGGAYSLGTNLSSFFLEGLDHVALKIADPINRALIPNLIKMNRGERPGYPQLKHSGISDKAGKELSELLKNYCDGQVIIPDDRLEDHIRKRHGFPKASTEGRRTPQAAQQGTFGTTGNSTGTNASVPVSNSLAERIRLAEFKNQARRKALFVGD